MSNFNRLIRFVPFLVLIILLSGVLIAGCGNDEPAQNEENDEPEETVNDETTTNDTDESNGLTDKSAVEVIESEMDEVIDILTQEWETLEGEQLNYPEDIEVTPEDFQSVISANYTSDKDLIAFVLEGPYHSTAISSAVGVYDLLQNDVSFTNLDMGQAAPETPIWNVDKDHFAYTLNLESKESILYVDSSIQEDNKMVKKGVDLPNTDELTGFRNLEWDKEGNQLYFTSYDVEDEDGDIKDWILDLPDEEIFELPTK